LAGIADFSSTQTGLRDRALIGLMVYSFARIGAALGMSVEDVYTQNRRLWTRLREKGGKHHAMPCHHNLDEYPVAYLDGAGLRDDPKGHDRPRHWPAHPHRAAAGERLCDDPPARCYGRYHNEARRPQLPRDRDHRPISRTAGRWKNPPQWLNTRVNAPVTTIIENIKDDAKNTVDTAKDYLRNITDSIKEKAEATAIKAVTDAIGNLDLLKAVSEVMTDHLKRMLHSYVERGRPYEAPFALHHDIHEAWRAERQRKLASIRDRRDFPLIESLSEFEQDAIIQHYRSGTPFLDFTESICVAAFFAAHRFSRHDDLPPLKGAVVVVSPRDLQNELALGHVVTIKVPDHFQRPQRQKGLFVLTAWPELLREDNFFDTWTFYHTQIGLKFECIEYGVSVDLLLPDPNGLSQ
jgi:hypothetical protein